MKSKNKKTKVSKKPAGGAASETAATTVVQSATSNRVPNDELNVDVNAANESIDNRDSGGFNYTPDSNVTGSSNLPRLLQSSENVPPLPSTLPPSSTSSSYRANNEINELSSLSQNKMSGSNASLNRQQQFPILNMGANQTPPTPKRRLDPQLANNAPNIVKSPQKPTTYKNLNDMTPSAHDILNKASAGLPIPSRANLLASSSGPGLGVSVGVSSGTGNHGLIMQSSSSGVYSPSTAEARRYDAAAPDSNLSHAAKIARLPPPATTSNGLPVTGQTSQQQPLGSVIGGYKVLPTPTSVKLINVNHYPLCIYLILCTRLCMNHLLLL
jgi:hypothetical protein